LAFSVAAHLEPEILIIDEVLAVGDAEFQKKCLGKMEDVAGEGRTVIFVSHNMAAVESLCDRAVFLDKGKIEFDGGVNECIDFYIKKNKNEISSPLLEIKSRKGFGEFVFDNHSFFNKTKKTERFHLGEDILLKLDISAVKKEKIYDLRIDLGLNNSRNERISWLSSSLHERIMFTEGRKSVNVSIEIKEPFLIPGTYNFTLNLIVNGKNQDWIPNVCKFEILEAPFFRTGNFPPSNQGDFLLKHSFKVKDNEKNI